MEGGGVGVRNSIDQEAVEDRVDDCCEVFDEESEEHATEGLLECFHE